jgi:hypothetical protein
MLFMINLPLVCKVLVVFMNLVVQSQLSLSHLHKILRQDVSCEQIWVSDRNPRLRETSAMVGYAKSS